MAKRLINAVESNEGKRKTYAFVMDKYKKAMESGFYGEAELIVYAFLEDRLRSFLYYSGALDHWNSKNINEDMASIYGEVTCIYDITAKLEIINKVIDLNSVMQEFGDNDYANYLINKYRAAIDISEVDKLLTKINKWREYRNEVVHALLNKDLDHLHQTYRVHVEEGYKLARQLDNYVGALKRS